MSSKSCRTSGSSGRHAYDRVNRLLQLARHPRHAGRTFAGERLAIEFSFAGNDDVGALDILARRSIASATTSKPDRIVASQKVSRPNPRPPAAPAPGDVAVIAMQMFAPRLPRDATGHARGFPFVQALLLFVLRRCGSRRSGRAEGCSRRRRP